MVSHNPKVLAILNPLIATCKDGENGYRSAQADVQDQELKDLFGSYVVQRGQFAAELLAKLHELDTAAARRGSAMARIHRGWMNMKAALARRDGSTVAGECTRGEAAALKDYERALKQPLPPDVEALVRRQYDAVKAAHEYVQTRGHVAVLDYLISVCKNGESGYRSACEDVEQTDLKELFASLRDQRARLAEELQAAAHPKGDALPGKGTLAATMHRGWMNLKAAVKKGDPGAVLREVDRGERSALRHYEQALQQAMPAEAHALLERQYGQLKAAYGCIRALEREVKAV
jgi:uncharacterized protein (TIGR02284 family)